MLFILKLYVREQYAVKMRCCVVFHYHTHLLAPRLRMTGANPPLPNVPLWCAQGQFCLSHYHEMSANVVILHSICPLFCLATIVNVQQNTAL